MTNSPLPSLEEFSSHNRFKRSSQTSQPNLRPLLPHTRTHAQTPFPHPKIRFEIESDRKCRIDSPIPFFRLPSSGSYFSLFLYALHFFLLPFILSQAHRHPHFHHR
ncbi:hypothetical protein IE53DRAFT_165759 [Violaceomyces palustris]|uniref:Uncharacterized protein n=1 Tax=Violaceomyces palustris TaxID=1673888 RepID=A0ACD0NTK0_9BASI|nr:hypothetical protein IE53DRAFT_165759 [Violaceomyces palustris]